MERTRDFVQQFNFIIAHISGKMNTAADVPSCVKFGPNENSQLKSREDFPTPPIEFNIDESTGIAQEE